MINRKQLKKLKSLTPYVRLTLLKKSRKLLPNSSSKALINYVKARKKLVVKMKRNVFKETVRLVEELQVFEIAVSAIFYLNFLYNALKYLNPSEYLKSFWYSSAIITYLFYFKKTYTVFVPFLGFLYFYLNFLNKFIEIGLPSVLSNDFLTPSDKVNLYISERLLYLFKFAFVFVFLIPLSFFLIGLFFSLILLSFCPFFSDLLIKYWILYDLILYSTFFYLFVHYYVIYKSYWFDYFFRKFSYS